MGFFDRFTSQFDDLGVRWSDAGANLGRSWQAAKDAFNQNNAVIFNLVQTAFGGKDEKENAEAFWAERSFVNRLFDQIGTAGAAAGGVLGAAGDVAPPLRVGFGFADALQHELVGRPVSTALLVRADAVNSRNLGQLVEGDTWRQAYNDTSYVTPGQAFTFGMFSNIQEALEMLGVAELDARERKAILDQFPTVGIIAQDPQNFDPRRRGDPRQQFYDNSLMRGLSGTLDVGIVMFGDPTLALGKVGSLAKTRYISNEMTAAALQSGRLEGHISSKAYRNAKDFIRNADNSQVVQRRMFNNHYDGDLASALLFDAARAQDEYAARGGRIDLYDTTFRAMYGDVTAWDTLTAEAPRIADVIGSERANFTIATAARNYGTGGAEVDARVNSLMESKRQAWVDATVAGHGMWGKISDAPLAGQAVPRLRATSAWRTGVHSFVRNKAPVVLGNWARRGQFALPSQRSGRMLDLNDPNSSGVFRATLSRSRLDQDELDRWVGAYSRATSSEGRFIIYSAAENYTFLKHAERYGLTAGQLDRLVPQMNRFRRGNRQILQANRRYASDDVKALYEQRLQDRRLTSANELANLKVSIDEAVKRGDTPAHYYSLPDEQGNLTLVPEDSNLRLDQPILATQHADIVPMVDWHVLENALWWHVGFGRGKPATRAGDKASPTARVGQAVYGTQDLTRAALEAAMSVWKVTAILRPGYIWRTLSDEIGRIWAKQGAFSSFATMGRGSKNTARNMRSRTRIVGEIIDAKRARGTSIEVDAEPVATGRPSASGARLSADPNDPDSPAAFGGGDLNYSSIEEWFADGGIGVDDYLGRVEAMGSAGTLNGPLAEIYDAYRAGTKPEREYRRHAIDYAMKTAGRAAYTSPAWQRALLRMADRAQARKAPGRPGKMVVLDPFSGESPDLTRHQIDNFFAVTKSRHISVGPDGIYNVDDVYDFIADNVDELLLPDRLMSAYRTPDGRIALGVGYSTHPRAPDDPGVKPTGGLRAKLPFGREGDLLRDSGYADITVRTPAGTVTVHGAFQGGEGDRFRKQASNRGPEDAWVDAVTDTEFSRWVEKSQRWVDIGPDDWEAYKTSWERAVNVQLGQDPMARQFLQGKSYNDVVNWLFNTNEGRAYHWRMGPWRSQFAEQAAMVESMVDAYLPLVEARRGESLAMRQKAMSQKATAADLEQVMTRDKMPRVHGATLEMATGRGPIMDLIKRKTDNIFKAISDLPNDKLARFPFAAERYRFHVRRVAEARGVGKAAAGQMFGEGDLRKIEQTARNRALRDVQRYLFQTNATWDLAKSLRLFVPFGSAIADSGLKWGVVLRERPAAANQVWKLWNAPDRAGLVQDENGNQLEFEQGQEVWYQVNPATGKRTRLEDHTPKDRFVVFRLPSFLSERFYGEDVRPQVRINKRVAQTFLDLPTAGPLVAMPANKFALENPEFADNGFVKQWILPLGASANTSSALIPANVRNVRQVVFPNWAEQDRQTAEGQAIAIFASEMTSYTLGQRPNPPTFEEARDKAASMRGLRFWAAFGAGISPQVQSPYQPYVDYYRQLRVRESELRRQAAEEGRDQSEVEAADQRFYDEMGEEFFNLTARVTRNALGIPATLESNRAYKKYQDLIDKYPDIASLIIGEEGAGEFNRAVYEAQKLLELRPGSGEKQRGRLSMEESWEDTQRRQGWLEFTRQSDLWTNDMIRLGVTSFDQIGAERIKAARDQWIQERMFIPSPWGDTVLNPWFEDFRSVDTSRMIGRLNSLRAIVQDPRLRGRDDIRGLIDYLSLRDRFTGHMDRTGVATLSGEEAAPLRAAWDRTVFQLRESNPSFSALHDRWLTGDQTLEAR